MDVGNSAITPRLRWPTDLPDGLRCDWPVQPFSQKYFRSPLTRIKSISLPSRPTEGRLAIVTDAGRDAVDAGGAKDEGADLRTAKSCGSDASTPASSLREEAQATVTKKPDRRGEHEISRKTIARGMPGDSGVTVVTTLVCFFISHARLRVHWASGIPCALCRAKDSCTTRAYRAAGTRSYV
jgi:hypothetical protein